MAQDDDSQWKYGPDDFGETDNADELPEDTTIEVSGNKSNLIDGFATMFISLPVIGTGLAAFRNTESVRASIETLLGSGVLATTISEILFVIGVGTMALVGVGIVGPFIGLLVAAISRNRAALMGSVVLMSIPFSVGVGYMFSGQVEPVISGVVGGYLMMYLLSIITR